MVFFPFPHHGGDQREDAGVRARPLRVDRLELAAVSVHRVLRVRDRGGFRPDRRVLEDVHGRVVRRHALVEGVGPVGSVGRGQVTLEVEHVAGFDLRADVGAGVQAVVRVGRAHHHVHLADPDDGVDGHQLHVMRGRVAYRRAQAGRGLRVHDDRLGALGDQGLDLGVLQARVGRGEQRAEQANVQLRGVLGFVVEVRGPEGRAVAGEVHADGVLRAIRPAWASSAVLASRRPRRGPCPWWRRPAGWRGRRWPRRPRPRRPACPWAGAR